MFTFNSGVLGITGSGGLTIGSGGPLGSTLTLGTGQSLNVANAASVASGATLTINGGQMTAAVASNAGVISFQSGLFTASGSFFNQSTGRMSVGGPGTIAVNGVLTNQGRIQMLGGTALLSGAGSLGNTGVILGAGEIALPTTNAAGGQIQAESGQYLLFSAANGPNAGTIILDGGTVEFSQPLTNAAGGAIEGRGMLMVDSPAGLTNQGNIGFSAGLTNVYATVNNAAGATIITSGGGTTSFWNNVSNSGLIHTSTGCTSAFFDTVTLSGTGSITGPGIVDLEGPDPGAGPSMVSVPAGSPAVSAKVLLSSDRDRHRRQPGNLRPDLGRLCR